MWTVHYLPPRKVPVGMEEKEDSAYSSCRHKTRLLGRSAHAGEHEHQTDAKSQKSDDARTQRMQDLVRVDLVANYRTS